MGVYKRICIFPGLIIMATGGFLAVHNQALFAGLSQMFMIVIGFLTYFLAIHTHTYSHDSMLVFLGRAYILIALINLLQLIGAGNLGNEGVKMISVGSRLMEAFALFMAPWFVSCSLRSWIMPFSTAALILLVSWAGLPIVQVPALIDPSNSSMVGYLILTLLLLGIPLLLNRAQLEEHPAYNLLAVMAGVMAISEIVYLVAGGRDFGMIFLLLLRVLAYYLLLFVLLLRGIKEPYERLHRAYEETLDGWGEAMDMRDWETEGHCRRVAELTVKLATRCGIRGEKLVDMYRGALLHDIGKLAVPDQVLLKKGELTPEEWVLMKRHPEHALHLLGKIDFLRSAMDIPSCHHERWDGSGYPRGLRGEEIPLSARIFALVDVWDALSHDRPYRQAWPPEKIFAWLEQQTGIQFDPFLTPIFISFMRESLQPQTSK